MIILNLQGGIGNQIFQYNFALLLANRLNTKIIINDEIIRRGNFKNELFRLGIKHKKFSSMMGRILYFLCSVVYKFNLRKLINSRYLYFYLDPETGYDPTIESIKSKVIFLNGYFQSYDYLDANFHAIQDSIYNSMPCIPPSNQNCDQVCVHIRRGDYLDAANKQIFCQISMDYYHKALQLLNKKFDGKLLFKIFSNDIEYCKANFNDSNYRIIFVQNNDPIDDFKEMICCKHFIISNSTFSLLASIYSKSDDKLLIAPKKWFNHKKEHSIVPSSYLRI